MLSLIRRLFGREEKKPAEPVKPVMARTPRSETRERLPKPETWTPGVRPASKQRPAESGPAKNAAANAAAGNNAKDAPRQKPTEAARPSADEVFGLNRKADAPAAGRQQQQQQRERPPRPGRAERPGRSAGVRSDRGPRRGRSGHSDRHGPRDTGREPVMASEEVFPAPAVSTEPWDPSQFAVPEAEGKKRFQDFDLPDPILHAISDLGFQYCTPIQAETLGLTMAGRNVAGRAQTGTGKTAAFLIAILKRMVSQPESRPTTVGAPAALAIAPTRELVIQIAKDAINLGKYCGLRCVAVYGGMDYDRQRKQIEAGPVDLVVATPGRLLDFSHSRTINLSHIHTLVIDEADRMLDMGFIPDVRKIIRQLPEARQTLLFSATLSEDVMRLSAQWMPDPVKVEIEPEHKTVDTIEQIVYPITSAEKLTVLCNFLKQNDPERVLVFRNRRMDCERLQRALERQGFPCEVLSGDVAQNRRLRVLEDFRAGRTKVVIATDVAGRGIHVDNVQYVFNYDFPYEAEDYIHRIGRTGRAGHVGTAISFACEDESFIIPDIEKLLGEELPCRPAPDELLAPLPEPQGRRPSGAEN